MLARAQVFGNDASRVLNGHIPAAEIDHPGSHPAVNGVQWGLFQLRGRLAHGKTQNSTEPDRGEDVIPFSLLVISISESAF
jgi:hypothetical protein